MRRVSSLQEFEAYFDDGDEGELALVVPADFNQALDSGERPVLSGYVLWHRRFSARELEADFEQQLAELVDKTVSVRIEGVVVPELASMGAVRMTSLTALMALILIGMLTVPHLLLEEREAKTLDTLLISPANVSQVVLGKALAGLFYVLAAVLASIGDWLSWQSCAALYYRSGWA